MQPETHHDAASAAAASIPAPPSPTLPSFRRHPHQHPHPHHPHPHHPHHHPHAHVAPTVDNGDPLPSSGPNSLSPLPSSSAASSSNPSNLLRRRSHADDANSIRISLHTPFTELGTGSRLRGHGRIGTAGTRKEGGFVVPKTQRVAELKDELAAGKVDDVGAWVREGMRLIHQGRIVRDDETLGEIVGNREAPVHTFHLVARPQRRPDQSPYSSLPASPLLLPEPITTQPTSHTTSSNTASSSSAPAATAAQTLLNPSRIQHTSTALLDSVHYLLFTARFHLCHLLNAPVLRWDETVPPPVVAQDLAREAVMSVVRAFVRDDAGRTEGWEAWEAAFESVEDVVARLGEGVEEELQHAWAGATGRSWSREPESVVVEVDLIPYTLHLPPVFGLSQEYQAHLLVYLRITSLLPLLSECLSRPAPTPTIPILPPGAAALLNPPFMTYQLPGQRRPVNAADFAGRAPQLILRRTFHVPYFINIPSIPFTLVSQLFFSFLRLAAICWMLTRDMRLDDPRLWIISSFCGGWWLVEAIGKLAVEREAQWRRAEQEREQQRQQQNENDPIGEARANPQEVWERELVEMARHAAADAPAHAAAAARARPMRQPNQPAGGRRGSAQSVQRTINGFDYLVPLFHLDIDNEQLRLPRSTTDRTRPGAQTPAPRLRRTLPSHPPSRWLTQILLPIYLWFVTLIPEFEVVRARAIRRRERAMRVLVGELASAQAREQAGSEDQDGNDGAGAGGVQGEEGMPREEGRAGEVPPAPVILPGGLHPAAEGYYRRVMERGEGIDWEEEREAQRALGIADEDEDQGGNGMGMRML